MLSSLVKYYFLFRQSHCGISLHLSLEHEKKPGVCYEITERVPFTFRYGLIHTPKGALFDRDHRKGLGLVFAWGYTKKKN